MATVNGSAFNDNNTVNGIPRIFRSSLVGTSLNDIINGFAGNDTLEGRAGNDTLNGGTGADTMNGGSGDDIYYVDNTGDIVQESSGEGNDKVYASVTTTLSANVEQLILIGTANINGYGNRLNNTLFGNNGANALYGLDGNDSLIGGAGQDRLFGGRGDDTYYIDSDDVVVENAREGYDTIITSISTTLGNNVERLILQGKTSADGTGNELDNGLFGNAGNNTLKGLAGNDHLNGDKGADTLIGGVGNDTYYGVGPSDTVIEKAGEGDDYVITSVDTTLSANVERLSLQGTKNVNGTGNELDNSLAGNAGNNTLKGLAGNDHLNGDRGTDTLIGGLGNDTYYADRTDIIKENTGEGYDTVITGDDRVTLSANVERLILQGTGDISGFGNNENNTIFGNYSNNRLFGNAGDDYIQGTRGNNYLHGGQGNDTLVGSNGDDTLVGTSGNDVLTGHGGADKFTFFKSTDGIDQIKDFSRVQGDTIEVVAQGFGGNLAKGALASDQFVLGASAQDANDRFIYNNGTLSFDVDGIGGAQAVQIATFAGNPTLSHSDIIVI